MFRWRSLDTEANIVEYENNSKVTPNKCYLPINNVNFLSSQLTYNSNQK